MRNTKKQRQRWWKNLSDEEKELYLKKIFKRKAIKRMSKSIRVMKNYIGKYKCSDCIHGKTKSCTDNLPNGCEYWFDPNSEKIGLAYS